MLCCWSPNSLGGISLGNKKKRWKKPLELGLEINNNRETAGPLSKHAALRALRQAIWWLAYATSIPNPKSDIAGEGLGRGRCATCINFKTIYLIKVSCSYLIFSVFFFFYPARQPIFSRWRNAFRLDLWCTSFFIYSQHRSNISFDEGKDECGESMLHFLMNWIQLMLCA